MHTAVIDRFGRIVVPKHLREAIGAHAGTELALEAEGGRLVARVLRPEQVLELDGLLLVADVEL